MGGTLGRTDYGLRPVLARRVREAAKSAGCWTTSSGNSIMRGPHLTNKGWMLSPETDTSSLASSAV